MIVLLKCILQDVRCCIGFRLSVSRGHHRGRHGGRIWALEATGNAHCKRGQAVPIARVVGIVNVRVFIVVASGLHVGHRGRGHQLLFGLFFEVPVDPQLASDRRGRFQCAMVIFRVGGVCGQVLWFLPVVDHNKGQEYEDKGQWAEQGN